MPCCKSSQWPRCSHVAHHVPMFSKHQHWTQRWQLFQLCSWISYIEWSDGPNALEWTKRPAHPPPKNSHMDNNTRFLCCLQTGRMLLRKLLLCSSSHFQTREIWTGITSRIGSDIWGSNGGRAMCCPFGAPYPFYGLALPGTKKGPVAFMSCFWTSEKHLAGYGRKRDIGQGECLVCSSYIFLVCLKLPQFLFMGMLNSLSLLERERRSCWNGRIEVA